jgi:hypothetical protein
MDNKDIEKSGIVSELVKSIAKQPLMALLLVMFLVQSWIQVMKLDTINETLVAIHKDNVRLEEYIDKESEDTKNFISVMSAMKEKIDIIYENTRSK